MKRILIALLLLLPLAAMGKPAYKITLQIDGNKDSMMLLCFYYTNTERIADTAFNDGKGNFVFEGDQELLPGLYFFTNNRNRYVEFVIYHEKPNFRFYTDDRAWTMNMRVKGSKQNEVFFNYKRATETIYREIEESKNIPDSAARAEHIDQLRLRIDTISMDVIKRHPEAMISKMMMAIKDIDVPSEKADGTKMTQRERYDYVMDHYFDNMPLDDDFLVRTPKTVFYQRVMDYIEKFMRAWPPEMICPRLDTLIDRSQPAEEVNKWLIYKLTDHYLQSNIMVYDEVYVHLVMRYFATGKAPWFDPSTIDENVERATKWERLLVGRESPELILFDTSHHAYSLHRMKGDYTLLVFWSPTCGHCREIIPDVYQVFNEYQDSLNLTAFAILSEPDEKTVEKWKKFLVDHGMTSRRWVNLNGSEANVDWREVYDIQSTPQIYLIENKNHTFVAKKLNANIFREICKGLTKQSQQ